MKTYQHYVPQLYLRGFFDPVEESKGQNVLWLYRQGYRPLRVPTKNVGGEALFYSYTDASGDRQDWIEDRLGTMEHLVAPTVQKLRVGNFTLTAQERSEFAGFIALTICRGKFFFDFTNRVATTLQVEHVRELVNDPDLFARTLEDYRNKTGDDLRTTYEEMRDFMQKVSAGEVQAEQTERGWTLRMMHEQMLSFMPVIERMSWGLLHAPSDTLFLTSDNPVAVHDPGLRIRDGALEYSRDASFTFPVSRSYALQGVLRPGGDGQENLRAYDVRSINKMIIERSYRYVYAPFRCDYISRIQEKSYAQHPERFPTIKQN